jgi:hypothetical protein
MADVILRLAQQSRRTAGGILGVNEASLLKYSLCLRRSRMIMRI